MRSSVPLHCCALGFESFSLQSASLCFQVVLRIFPEIMRLRLTVSPVGSGHVCQWQTSMTDRSEAKTGSGRVPPARLAPHFLCALTCFLRLRRTAKMLRHCTCQCKVKAY